MFYDVLYSQCSHQHVSVGIPAIFRVVFSLQEYNCGSLCHHHSIWSLAELTLTLLENCMLNGVNFIGGCCFIFCNNIVSSDTECLICCIITSILVVAIHTVCLDCHFSRYVRAVFKLVTFTSFEL
jgi:hypothetical protein